MSGKESGTGAGSGADAPATGAPGAGDQRTAGDDQRTVGDRRTTVRRIRHALVRTVLGGLSAVVVATPFVAAWEYHAYREEVSRQAAAPTEDGFDARPHALGPRHATAPTVLAYHDVAPHPRGRYTLTPARLDAQLSALHAAGYRTLSTVEFVRFLATGRSPYPRSVYLTFDDGTRGLWAYADPVLAKHGMTAAGYLITGAVGTHRPYYLSWAEVHRMAASRRWDFQAHTHLSHRRAPVDATGRLGSVLANRLWLPAAGRLETAAEYGRRVRRDLDRSLGAFADHGLPAPRLFAYPFSENARRTNLSAHAAAQLDQVLRAHFAATLTNTSRRPLPPGGRAAAAGQVQRLEVLGTTTPGALLHQLQRWASGTPGDVADPLDHPDLWESPGGRPGTGLDAVTGHGTRHGSYASAVYRPLATADWNTYTLRATAERLHGTGASASFTVHDGSLSPCTVTIGAHTVRVTQRAPGTPPRITSLPLEPASRHRLTVRITAETVRVTVDATVVGVHRTERAPLGQTTGGIALGVRNESPGTPWPRVAALTISPR